MREEINTKRGKIAEKEKNCVLQTQRVPDFYYYYNFFLFGWFSQSTKHFERDLLRIVPVFNLRPCLPNDTVALADTLGYGSVIMPTGTRAFREDPEVGCFFLLLLPLRNQRNTQVFTCRRRCHKETIKSNIITAKQDFNVLRSMMSQFNQTNHGR